MKHFKLKALTTITLAILLLFTLTSCSEDAKLMRLPEEERAIAIWERAETNADAADSYTTHETMKIAATIYGVGTNITATGTVAATGMQGDGMSYLTDMSMDMTANGATTTMTSVEGFRDGKMFLRQTSDGVTQQLYSAISQEDYITHLEETSEDNMPEISSETCSVRTCVKEEDGTYTLGFSGFGADSMELFADNMGSMKYLLFEDHTLSDVEITISVSEDFYPLSLTMKYVMTENTAADTKPPVISVTAEYSDFNATAAPAEIDFSAYTEVADLRLLDQASDLISERQTAESGAFNLRLTQKYTYSGTVETQTEIDDVTFTNRDGAYTYEVEAQYEGLTERYDISYENGKQTVIVTDGASKIAEEVVESDDVTANMFINSLMDPGTFSSTNIADITVLDEAAGRYSFTVLVPNMTPFEALIASVGGTLSASQATAEYILTIQNDRIVKYEYTMKINTTTTQLGALIIDYTAVVEHNDFSAS